MGTEKRSRLVAAVAAAANKNPQTYPFTQELVERKPDAPTWPCAPPVRGDGTPQPALGRGAAAPLLSAGPR